ncbi:TniQ family protein [Coleofasciculus sp. FACHB-542]|uniref:TniQ family protein n=1 Tax=Coleofasciculus sp. FACHB-542 TaxID=2692787 RepID=UPI0016830B89|nr:TniQ family protein [Coleofasciculus sp. FACHB-542]MBD2087881.1 TniQ family protein [Coleofasciculus sp. FACHB-542]
MTLADELQPWLFPVEPLEGESFSHFLGRFRRRNHLTPSALGQLARIGAVVARWERFHLNPFPSAKELEALAKVVGVKAQRLREMLPPQGVGMKCNTIRLCGACYAESPCHRMEWQFKSTPGCETHQLRLVSKCPNCEARFKVPALWENGCCDRCRLPFEGMNTSQKAY